MPNHGRCKRSHPCCMHPHHAHSGLRWSHGAFIFFFVGYASLPGPRADAEQISFTRDVMAVLSRSGCNSGACHGNLNGKGGFKLSLRGQDAAFDHEWLTHESDGRRIDRLSPEQSLILRKASGAFSHQGGARFRRDSLEYRILRDWIREGAAGSSATESPLLRLEVSPGEKVVIGELPHEVALRVVAHFADGTERNVTALATYEASNLRVEISPEGIVRSERYGESTVIVRYLELQTPVSLAFVPSRSDWAWQPPPVNNYIDQWVDRRLEVLRIHPSEIAQDQVFLRRVHLDALGVLPTADEAREFLRDDRPDRRERLVDALLARPEFADVWALRWSDVLRNEEKVLDTKGVEVFHRWIRESMAEGKPIDRFVRELIRATGSTYENPPANFWRGNRDPATRAETVARLFLGVRLQCAKCHNHPFDRWTQDDYYAWSAVFARIDYDILKNDRRDKLDKNEFVGEQIVKIADFGGVEHPRTRHFVPPRMLGGEALGPGAYQDRLTPLAVWLTEPENAMFARMMVNFVWYHLLGRGLVDPLDDLRTTNPAANEPLLAALADHFVASRFDLRTLVRTILTSRTYQLSAVPHDTDRGDETNFSHALILRLPAEKLLDAQSQVLDWPAEFAGYDRGIRAGQIPGVRRGRERDGSSGGDRFLRTFGKPERLLACECERSNETSLGQAFILLSGNEIQQRLSASGNRLDRWARSDLSDEQLVDELYWTALSRPPLTEERDAALELFALNSEPRDRLLIRQTALQDLAWALLNAKEFLFRW